MTNLNEQAPQLDMTVEAGKPLALMVQYVSPSIILLPAHDEWVLRFTPRAGTTYELSFSRELWWSWDAKFWEHGEGDIAIEPNYEQLKATLPWTPNGPFCRKNTVEFAITQDLPPGFGEALTAGRAADIADLYLAPRRMDPDEVSEDREAITMIWTVFREVWGNVVGLVSTADNEISRTGFIFGIGDAPRRFRPDVYTRNKRKTFLELHTESGTTLFVILNWSRKGPIFSSSVTVADTDIPKMIEVVSILRERSPEFFSDDWADWATDDP